MPDHINGNKPESSGGMTRKFSGRKDVIDTTKNLSSLISTQMKASPDAIALEDLSTSLTYHELDRKVEALADRLRSYGVGRDSLVGILIGRSANYVIACLAALRAGGACLILELAYPTGLMADVIEDAKPTVIVMGESHTFQLKVDIPQIILGSHGESDTATPSKNSKMDAPNANFDGDLERLAFVSYSSGTTGKPKGIANPHRAPVLSYNQRFHLSNLYEGDKVGCNVFFIWEIFRPLLRGATVFCIPDEISYDPVALVDILQKRDITETLMTPTLLAAVLSRHLDLGTKLKHLKTLWLNGEVVTTDLANRALKALDHTRLLNCYSASETHEIACGDIGQMLAIPEIAESSFCPVGYPIDLEHTYILNERGDRVDDGVSGELFVGGDMLARGYLNLPDTTAKAFLLDPFSETLEARMYRTGDVARMLPSGDLEITGRVGAMLKVRGYSIVPGKVENAIVEQLAVRHCTVIAVGEGLERQLVAYFVRDREAAESVHRERVIVDKSGYSPSSRRALSSSLAQYMIPALWVELETLPTHSVSGKIDQKRLPPPKVLRTRSVAGLVHESTSDRKTEGNIEISIDAIAEMWASSLNISPGAVTREHTFFDLGGHSLTLADLAGRFSKTYGFGVPLADLVVNPTLDGHLEIVISARDGYAAALQHNLPAILKADSVLDADLKVSGPVVQMTALEDAETVLLTGATGFLGAFLLSELVENTSAKIICLIRFSTPRSKDQPTGIARLRRHLLDLGLWKDSIIERIEVLPGNLSQDRFGLTNQAFDEVARKVQVIIHAGATVNLVYPYSALRGSNVTGTQEVLRLAFQSKATLQYISTNGVLPPSGGAGWPESASIDASAAASKLADGYGQSKWVAEQLVQEAARRGLPVRIIRAGTISGHSTSGSTNAWDLLNALIVESLHLGFAPSIEGWRAEMTPVDFVARAIMAISNERSSKQLVFHVGDPHPVKIEKLFADLSGLGFSTEKLNWNAWLALWDQTRGSPNGGDGAFTIDILRGGMPTVKFLKDIIVLDDAVTSSILRNIERPSIDIKLLETYARHWYARGWLARPPKFLKQFQSIPKSQSKSGPLHKKVAVVTGASSGIGAAVSKALARDGAYVVLAARRIEALKVLKHDILQSYPQSRVLLHQTDVTSRSQVQDLIQTTTSTLGPVDILVCCAGVMYFTLMSNVQADDWDRTVDVNCKGVLNCLSSTIPGMISRGSGHIVAISSDAGRKVFPGLGVYSASKFFVEATLQALRLETVGSGLRVTSVQPGNTETELLGLSTDKEGIEKYGMPSGAKVLDAADVAESVVWALRQPEHVAVNEVLIEPRDEPC